MKFPLIKKLWHLEFTLCLFCGKNTVWFFQNSGIVYSSLIRLTLFANVKYCLCWIRPGQKCFVELKSFPQAYYPKLAQHTQKAFNIFLELNISLLHVRNRFPKLSIKCFRHSIHRKQDQFGFFCDLKMVHFYLSKKR